MLMLLRSARPKAVLAELRSAGLFRVEIGALGVLVILYGGVRLLQDSKDTKPLALAKWLIGAVIVHDGIIAPLTVAVGWLISRYVPRRGRAFVQSGLAVAATVTLFALPFIRRRGKSGPGSALLKQNYTANLLLILAIVVGVTFGLYLLRVVRQRPSSTNERPAADQTPIG